ncbi:MAG: hypothetical protein JJ957_20085 [Pseudomonadales bacterium]|nr:hypothetical protein [Pseudomonadales bacterium]MBO6598009.1 hypothetical protein [Pseudomonadales bacterium]
MQSYDEPERKKAKAVFRARKSKSESKKKNLSNDTLPELTEQQLKWRAKNNEKQEAKEVEEAHEKAAMKGALKLITLTGGLVLSAKTVFYCASFAALAAVGAALFFILG